MKLQFKHILLCLLLGCNAMHIAAQLQDNIKGYVKCLGKGMPNILVTNGFDFALTNADGRYILPMNRNARFVYITTPSGYLPQITGGLPLFYQKLNEHNLTYDFVLTKITQQDNKHLFFVQTDVQVANDNDINGYGDYLKDICQYLKSEKKGRDAFVLDCGDIVGNTPSLFPTYIKKSETLELPIYRSIGNHDMEYGVRSFEHSYKTFESYFGPIYYSYNRGKAHYIVLDNCFYINRDYRYIGYIDERTLQWIEKDLSYVPKDHLVFVAMHIPTSSTKKIQFNALLPDETSNASSLYDLLKGYNAHLISGHTHNNWNVVFNDSLMEHNTAAVCGTFWKASICTDGTPKGYSVYEVDGNQVKWAYKSVGHPIDYQFRAYPIGASDDYPQDIIANVWNWDEQWRVEWYEDGKLVGEMEQFEGYDPQAKIICSDKKQMVYDWIIPIKTKHLFKATPRNKSAAIEIVVTDRFGNIYKQKVTVS